MKTIIQLESADIQKIIAEKFETSIENVKLRTKEVCTGYGPAETYINVPCCEIELTDQKKFLKRD